MGLRCTAALPFLESVPAVAAQLKEPNTKDRKFEDVVKSAEPAAVLVLVYGAAGLGGRRRKGLSGCKVSSLIRASSRPPVMQGRGNILGGEKFSLVTGAARF